MPSVQFQNDQGQTLAADLEAPPSGQPVAYALFAHCFTCSKDLRAAKTLARALCAQGLAVLRFDFTGLGQSEGDFAETTFSSNVDDLLAAARWLEREHEAPTLLVGHSLGGAAVLRAARELESVRAVATLGAPAEATHVKEMLEESVEEIERTGAATVTLEGRPFTITKAFLDDLDAQRMQETVRNLERPLLLFHAPKDQTVGIDNAAKLFEAAKHPKSFVSLDTADHLLTDEADAAYAGAVLAAWARRYVPHPEAQPEVLDAETHHVATRTEAGGFRTEVIASGHALIADEPTNIPGGTNTGPTPYDLVVAGLGACTSMTLHMYAERKGWPLEAATVRLTHQKQHAKDCAHCAEDETRVDHVERELHLEGPLSDEQRQRLVEIAERCPVHQTLERGLRITTRGRGE